MKDVTQNLEKRCVVFTCDEGYLFPTLVAAKMARRQAPADCDVLVFFDAAELPEDRRAVMEAASGASVQIIPGSFAESLQQRVSRSLFEGSHVSSAALYRLFVADLVGPHYDFILYMDGDIQIRHSLEPLFGTDLPKGLVAAVPDWAALHLRCGIPIAHDAKSYFEGLGLSDVQQRSYFNSGVMLARRETWAEIGPAALEFLVKHPNLCKFHDQSALNFTCRDRSLSLSPYWNFLRGFMHLPVYQLLDPAVIHFTARPKPWDGCYAPWGQEAYKPYVEMSQALAGSGVAWRRQSLWRRIGYHVKPYLAPNKDFANPLHKSALQRILADINAQPKACGVDAEAVA